jgi:hypothetical protein
VSRDEILAAIRKCTEDLGRVPCLEEFTKTIGLSKHLMRREFGPYVNALEMCGLKRHGCGYKIDLKDLFEDWATVTRSQGKTPTMAEYEAQSKYTSKALVKRYGGWKHVAMGMLGYAKNARLEDEWKDVMDITADSLKLAQPAAPTLVKAKHLQPGRRVAPGEPVYGPPMLTASPMVYAPTNEAGVMVLFGAVAREHGFAITRVQAAFPDCEAMREIEPERCQPTRIEFEYESRNFLLHLHPVDGADLIVCWKHNWPECPLEVLELKTGIFHQPLQKQKLTTD